MAKLDSQTKKKLIEVQKIWGCNIKSLLVLFRHTEKITGNGSWVGIRGYNSDASNHTEVADQLINTAVSYENMLAKDEETLENVNINEIDVFSSEYDGIFSGIDTKDMSLDSFKVAVKNSLKEALTEMLAPKEKRITNDIRLNKVLIFNTNTLRLSISGVSQSKTVTQKGEYKKVKSAPKTVAKAIIKKYAEPRTAKIRRFTVDNLHTCALKGDVLYIGGGEKMNLSGTLTTQTVKETAQ